MKAVHTYKFDLLRPMLESFGGPAMIKPIITLHALSAVTISKHFKDFVFITDDAGRELAKACKMPYGEIVSVGESFKAPGDFWIESKIHAYSTLQEPFVHFDTDLFLWKPLPEDFLAADVFAFHSETYAWAAYQRYLSNWARIIPNFPKLHEQHYTNRMPINMAIFGGNNWQAINQYAKFIQDFAASNNWFHDIDAADRKKINGSIAAIEQLWGSYLLQDQQGIRIKFLLTEYQVATNENVPGVELTHLHGIKQKVDQEKKSHEFLAKLSAKLKEVDETVYNAVEAYTSSEIDIDALLKESALHGAHS